MYLEVFIIATVRDEALNLNTDDTMICYQVRLSDTSGGDDRLVE
jgi:hypothetical protein